MIFILKLARYLQKVILGVVFESFLNIDTCSPVYQKPKAPILILSHVDLYSDDFYPFLGNIFTVSGVLPNVKLLPGLQKKIIVKFGRDFGDVSMRKHWPKI